MDKKIRQEILTFLFSQKKELLLSSVEGHCIKALKIDEKSKQYDEFLDIFNHTKDILADEGLVSIKTQQVTPSWSYSKIYLTTKGYAFFDPWYKKFWSFLNDDFVKLLSLVSIILSITATTISLFK